MSTDRQHKKVIFICDGCEEVLETGIGDFRDAYAHARLQGWEGRPARGKRNAFEHFCNDCK